MKKKIYEIPQMSVENYNSVLMYVSGPASAPPDNFNGAPKRKTDVF